MKYLVNSLSTQKRNRIRERKCKRKVHEADCFFIVLLLFTFSIQSKAMMHFPQFFTILQ